MARSIEDQFDSGAIALSQWLTLELIQEGRIVCIGDVNRELGLEGGASTRLVDHLEAGELLYRCRSSVDRRVVGITLTAQGEAMIQAKRPRVADFWKRQLTIFSDAERRQLFAMLLQLKGRLIASVESGKAMDVSPRLKLCLTR